MLIVPGYRIAAYPFLTSGYSADIDQVLNNALFTVDYSEMVIVED